jgi:hypothetical protein
VGAIDQAAIGYTLFSLNNSLNALVPGGFSVILQQNGKGTPSYNIPHTTAHETSHLLDFLYSEVLPSNGQIIDVGGSATPGDTVTITTQSSAFPLGTSESVD